MFAANSGLHAQRLQPSGVRISTVSAAHFIRLGNTHFGPE
ncbi:hypothetical protein EV286_10832 [Rhizobium sp. BK251]|nr:hypothetical protein EV286_10832 [Rhizobium sp. BK251]